MARLGEHLREVLLYPCQECGVGDATFLPGRIVNDGGEELEARRCEKCRTEVRLPSRIWVSGAHADPDGPYPGSGR